MVKKQNLDSVKRSAPRKQSQSYEAPPLRRAAVKKDVPQEYRTFKKAPKGRGGLLFFFFLLFVAAATGFLYWNGRNDSNVTESLKMDVSVVDKIVSGDEVVYKVEYSNLDKVALTAMELSVYWPAGFYFDEASVAPENENAKTWLLSDLNPGQTQTLEIKGQLVGRKDDTSDAVFSLGYQPTNFHSDFVAKQTVSTKIIDQKIELEVFAQDKTLVENEQEIKVVYRNLTSEALTDLYLDILYPDDWNTVSVEPTKETQYWVSSLEPNESKEIILKGNFGIDSKTDQLLVVEVGKMVSEKFRRLMRAEHPIIVVNPKFEMNLSINGKTGDQQADWGDDLRYQLEITNVSEGDVKDVEVTALLAGGLLNWGSLETVGEYLEDRIGWSKDQDATLAEWKAGEKKVFTWSADLVTAPQPERILENIIQMNISGLENWEQLENVSQVNVGENLTFNNGIYWHLGGRRVGTGMLPPQVGEKTQYLVVWSLPQSTGDFEQVAVKTTLPPDVAFAGETEIQEGTLTFDEESKTLTWALNDLQDLLLPVTASFMIEIEPATSDKGQAMLLLNTVSANAYGSEEVVVKSKALKTSDVVAESSKPVGLVQ
jgi:hypothetical protein